MSICKELDEAVQKYLRTATFPVAVKTLENAEQFPERTRRPLRDMGHRLNLCQGVALARRFGWTMGFCEEDHSCSNSLILMGIREVPEFIKNGSIVSPSYTDTLEHGAITQSITPRSERPLSAILLAPLHRADFDPDVVLFYCNPGQAVRLVQAALYHSGGTIESKFMGRCACATEIAVTLQTDQCQVVVPGGGEKVFGMLGDDEMVFTAPASRLRDIIRGLADSHKAGAARIPSPYYGLQAEPKFPPIYAELERCFGLRED